MACIPVALWSRASCAGPVRAAVRELVSSGRLAELPERLRKVRASSEPGKWLTLLWDDPTDPLSSDGFCPGPSRV